MLKLSRALIHQAEEINTRLLARLATQTTVSKSSFIHSLDPLIIKGILYHIDDQTTELENDEEYISALDLSLAYLRRLTISESLLLFLSLEQLVMNSGSGSEFAKWRSAWQHALMVWVMQAEQAHRARDQLSSLVSMSERQQALLAAYHLDYSSIIQRVSEHLEVYLEGRAALPKQLVLLLDAQSNIQWTHIASSIVKLFIADNNGLSGDPSIFSACASAVHLSFVQYLNQLSTVAELRAYPLLTRFMYGNTIPIEYQSVPSRSLKVLFLKELSSFIAHREKVPSVVMVMKADHLEDVELELWATLIDIYRNLNKPFALLLVHSQADVETRSHLAKNFNIRSILCEEFDVIRAMGSGSKLGERLNEWDQKWTFGLLGYQEGAPEDKDRPLINESLWTEAFFHLSPEYQAQLLYCLSPLRSLFEINILDHRVMDLSILKRLAEAGWIKEVDGLFHSTTWYLTALVNRLSSSPKRLVNNTAQAIQILLELVVTDDLANMEMSSHGTLGYYRKKLTFWIVQLIEALDESGIEPSSTFIKLRDRIGRMKETLVGCLVLSDFHLQSKSTSVDQIDLHVDTQRQLSRELEIGLPSLLRDYSGQDLTDYYNQVERIEEMAYATGDIQQLAVSYYVQATLKITHNELDAALPLLANAHRLSCQLGIEGLAFTCRSTFICLLAQSGHSGLAQQLLNVEYESLKLNPQWSDDIRFMAGVIAAHQSAWPLALTHFSSITHKTNESLVWEALVTLQSSDDLMGGQSTKQSDEGKRQVAQSAQILLQEANLLGIESFDIELLSIWLKCVIHSVLAEQQDSSVDGEYIMNKVRYMQEPTRGLCYADWALRMLPSSVTDQVMIEELATLEQRMKSLYHAWDNGYQSLAVLLGSHPHYLSDLLPPSIHISQKRSLLRFSFNQNKIDNKIWELNMNSAIKEHDL